MRCWDSIRLLAVVTACLSILTGALPQEINQTVQPERTVWFAAWHRSFGDGHSKNQPIDASNAEKLNQALERLAGEQGFYGDGLVMRFLPGQYETQGIRVRPRWHLIGAGIGKTIFKLVPTKRDFKVKTAYHFVVHGGWGPQFSPKPEKALLENRNFDNIRVADLSLDCNWPEMKAALGSILKKVAGIDLLVRQALVERVQVTGFGAQGGRPSWREVFPIRVISGMGDGAQLPGYRDSIIEVRDCIVEGAVAGPRHGTEWPYCTGIMVSHKDADLQNGTVDVRVHHNHIRNIFNGIAFGGAYLKKAEFHNNTVTGCGTGFNFDTGGNRGVVIRDNRFVDCTGGGTVKDGKFFVIRGNTFQLSAPGQPRFAWQHNGLRLMDYTRGFLVEKNHFSFAGEGMPKARGVLVHGSGIGLRWFKDGQDKWQRELDPHRFRDNLYAGLMSNLAGPQQTGQSMHLVISDTEIYLTGTEGQEDGVQFTWPDD